MPMCFSATASFSASALLGVTGLACLQVAEKKQDKLLASLPLLFAIQQFIEGLLWLYHANGMVTYLFAYAFLFFAFLVWPIYVPLVAYLHETDQVRKKILKYVTWAGVAGSMILAAILVHRHLEVTVVQNSLCYIVDFPYQNFGIVIYIAITVGALMISTNQVLRMFGLAAFLSASIAWQFYRHAFTSVWCFFCALLSMTLYWGLLMRHNKTLDKIAKLL